MIAKFIAQLISFFLIAGAAFGQSNMSITLDDGSVMDPATYSFTKDIENNDTWKPMACPSATSLVTFYATNNAQRGTMFDIQAINPVVILCFDANLSAGTSSMEIYTKTGTHVGFENTAAAWTLIGTAAGVTSAGVNLPTAIPIAINQSIAAGATRAFYITRNPSTAPTLAYTNGTLTGNVLVSNSDIRILEGTGKEYPFSTNFKPRKFNGRVYYNPGILPIELTEFDAKHSGQSVQLSWTTASEKNNDHFTVERSKDAENFEEVENIKGAGNSSSALHYSAVDEHPLNGLSYYRIKQTDTDNKSQYSEIKAVSYQRNINNIEINPIPTQKNIILSFKAIESGKYAISIFNSEGRLVYSKDIHVENGANDTPIDVSELPIGIYQLTLSSDRDLQRTKFIKE